MPSDSSLPPSQVEVIYRLYVALASTMPLDAGSGLGGKLLYAGEIDAKVSSLLYAANIAGAASLAASANVAVQRQAMRDGAIDFLVTSLEEALRILKNEIRKRQPVSVSIAIDPLKLTEQVLERGVLPDLLPSITGEAAMDGAHIEKFLSQGARQITEESTSSEGILWTFVTWTADRDAARWLSRLDACAQAVVPAGDLLRQRWLRLGPRYLGRLANREHGVALTLDEKARLENEFDKLLAQQTESESKDAADRPTVTLKIHTTGTKSDVEC
jgi:hypothetical protein